MAPYRAMDTSPFRTIFAGGQVSAREINRAIKLLEGLARLRGLGGLVRSYSAARTLSLAMPSSAVGRSMAKTFSGVSTP